MGTNFLGTSRIEIGKLIGHGGMGEVYDATLIGTGNIRRRVAAKRLNPSVIIESSAKEAQILSSLKHPNIILS